MKLPPWRYATATYLPTARRGRGLTGDGDVAVGFALVDHVHDLVRAGDEALGASLGEMQDERLHTCTPSKTRLVRDEENKP